MEIQLWAWFMVIIPASEDHPDFTGEAKINQVMQVNGHNLTESLEESMNPGDYPGNLHQE
jgi:hypothetical protein